MPSPSKVEALRAGRIHGSEVVERRLRLLWLGAVIVTSLLATLLLTPPEGSLSVDDVMSDPDQRKGDSISVRGIVENGT